MRNKLQNKLGAMRADQHLWEVMKGASSSLMIRILGSILGFVVSVAIARMLGAEGSGVYYLSLSVATIAATVGRVGFDNTVVRFVASHASVQEWGAVRQVYITAMKVVAVASLLIAVGLFFSAEWIAKALFDKLYMKLPLRLVSVSVLPLSFAMIHAESLRGLKAIPASQWIKTVLTSLGTLLLLYPLAHMWGTNGVVAAFVTATIVTSVVAWLIWRRALTNRGGGAQYGLLKKEILFRSSWPLFGAAMTGLVLQQAATVFLGIWGEAGDVGIFNVANRVASLLLFPLMAMISILTPKFAALHRQGNLSELAHLARRSSHILTVFAVPVVVGLYISTGKILSLFGPEFGSGIWVLRILLVGVLVNASTGAVAELLMMAGYEKECRNSNMIGAIITLCLCVILVPFIGVIGAASGMVIGVAGKNIMMVIVVKKRLGFWPITAGLARKIG